MLPCWKKSPHPQITFTKPAYHNAHIRYIELSKPEYHTDEPPLREQGEEEVLRAEIQAAKATARASANEVRFSADFPSHFNFFFFAAAQRPDLFAPLSSQLQKERRWTAYAPEPQSRRPTPHTIIPAPYTPK